MIKIVCFFLIGVIVFLLSCGGVDDPLSSNMSETNHVADKGSRYAEGNLKISVSGQFTLSNIVTWGQQGSNPGGRYFVKGLIADFITDGTLVGGGQLEQYAFYDETLNGPTHGSIDWTIDWNGEQVLLSGRLQGKSYPSNGVNILETNGVLRGTCSSGELIVKTVIVGPSLGPFSYSGTLIAP